MSIKGLDGLGLGLGLGFIIIPISIPIIVFIISSSTQFIFHHGQWVRVTIEQSFFIYNTRYFIQLYNNNISRRSESKVFSTPLCRKPARNYRACLDSKNDVNPSRQGDWAGWIY